MTRTKLERIMTRVQGWILTAFLMFSGVIISSLDGQELFAPLNTVWNMEGVNYNLLYTYRAEKEVVIAGKKCVQINFYANSPEDVENLTFQGDSLIVYEEEGKVFFYHEGDFYLTMDFSAQIGDSLSLYARNDSLGNFGVNCETHQNEISSVDFVVTDIEEFTIDSGTGKRFRLEYQKEEYKFPSIWYSQFIGAHHWSFSIFPNFLCPSLAEGYPGIRCLVRDDFSYKPYQEQSGDSFFIEHPGCKDIMSSNDVLKDHQIEIKMMQENINLSTDEKIMGLSLYSVSGKLVRNFDKSERQIYVSDLSRGMYVLVISLDRGIVREKVVLR